MADEIKKGITGRHESVFYYKVNDTFELMSVFTENTESFNAQTTEKKYTVNKTATKDTVSYQWEMAYSGDMIKSNAVIKDMVNMARTLAVGSGVIREIVIVELDEPIASKENTFYARWMEVSNSVSEFADNDGELQVNGTLSAHSDFKQGEFNVSTKTFTESAA